MSHLLNVKSRMPFVRQPSSESLLETGQGNAMAMNSLSSRPASVASTTDGLRPLSLRSVAPVGANMDSFSDSPSPGRVSAMRQTLRNGYSEATRLASVGYRKAEPVAKAIALPVALTGLTVWCITLTVYMAQANKDIADLLDMPACEDMGLVPKLQINQF